MIEQKFVRVDSKYVRDTQSCVIINTDTSQYNNIIQQRKTQELASTIGSLQKQVNNLVDEFNEIKILISQILGREDV